jgi:hypothetical protein
MNSEIIRVEAPPKDEKQLNPFFEDLNVKEEDIDEIFELNGS